MDGGACGGGACGGGTCGGGAASGLGLITLEDLEAMTEQNLDPEEEEEEEEEEEQEEQEEQGQAGLLRYWQNVGRVHRVDVPSDMAEPIQQLTAGIEHSPNKETPPFKLMEQKEVCGGVAYEKRVYDGARWACVTASEDTYEQSICKGFMKIMRYICQQNTSGSYLGMTVPIVTTVWTDESRASLSREVTVAYYLPPRLQNQPPLPADPDVAIETWSAAVVYSRAFTGPTNETTILREINALAELLDPDVSYMRNSFIIAGYSSVASAHRHNEVWLLERH